MLIKTKNLCSNILEKETEPKKFELNKKRIGTKWQKSCFNHWKLNHKVSEQEPLKPYFITNHRRHTTNRVYIVFVARKFNNVLKLNKLKAVLVTNYWVYRRWNDDRRGSRIFSGLVGVRCSQKSSLLHN